MSKESSKESKEEPKIVRYNNFSKNTLGVALPHVQILGSREENGVQKFFIHVEKRKDISGWYSKQEAKARLGISL